MLLFKTIFTGWPKKKGPKTTQKTEKIDFRRSKKRDPFFPSVCYHLGPFFLTHSVCCVINFLNTLGFFLILIFALFVHLLPAPIFLSPLAQNTVLKDHGTKKQRTKWPKTKNHELSSRSLVLWSLVQCYVLVANKNGSWHYVEKLKLCKFWCVLRLQWRPYWARQQKRGPKS